MMQQGMSSGYNNYPMHNQNYGYPMQSQQYYSAYPMQNQQQYYGYSNMQNYGAVNSYPMNQGYSNNQLAYGNGAGKRFLLP